MEKSVEKETGQKLIGCETCFLTPSPNGSLRLVICRLRLKRQPAGRLAHDSYGKAAPQRLMQLHFADGNRTAALQVYEAYSQMLAAEFGTKPTPEIEILAKTWLAELSRLLPELHNRYIVPAR